MLGLEYCINKYTFDIQVQLHFVHANGKVHNWEHLNYLFRYDIQVLSQSTSKFVLDFFFKRLRHKEEFEDSKGVIRICILKKDRQHNGQKKKDKRTNNDLQPRFFQKIIVHLMTNFAKMFTHKLKVILHKLHTKM